MILQHLPAFEYRRERWRNGLGWTREVAGEHAAPSALSWRVSIAEIDHNCCYSAFPGLRRMQTLVDGNGFRLDFADGHRLDCLPPHGRIDFSGDEVPSCVLVDGPVRVFNVFHDPQHFTAQLLHRPLVGSLLVFAETGTRWLLHQLAGHARLAHRERSLDLVQGDSALLDNRDGRRERLVLDGGGEVLLLSLAPP